jgi:hypothetical protein
VSTSSTTRARRGPEKIFRQLKNPHLRVFGAKDEIRTRDPDLGKVVLYQLSYFRLNLGHKNNHFFILNPNLPKKIENYSVTELLLLLQSFQNQSYKGFSEGLFFSERKIPVLYSRPDDTIFFNLSISFILHSLQEMFIQEQKILANDIIQKTVQLLPLYRNKDQQSSWNFWKTSPSQHFPLGFLAHRFRFFQIPDDIDDSALALIISGAGPELNLAFHQKIQRYANGVFKTMRYLPLPWRNWAVYNTFFIKEMPCSFDFVALCNLMIWHKTHRLPQMDTDKATLAFLNDALLSDLLLDNPALFSPYYPRLSLIVYHAARLEGLFPGSFQPTAKNRLLKLIQQDFSQRKNSMENLLFNIAALRLSVRELPQKTPSVKETRSFVFFVAGLFEEFSSPLLRSLRQLPLTHIQYHCEPMALTLWLEYLVLKEKSN